MASEPTGCRAPGSSWSTARRGRSTSSIASRSSRDRQADTLASLLDEFAALRQDNLRELAALRLTDADLDRRGRHPELGVVTLRQLLATWVAHDLDHVVQISRVLARQYSDEVGPVASVSADHQRSAGLSGAAEESAKRTSCPFALRSSPRALRRPRMRL